MGKKSRRTITSDQLTLYRVHCECVRRNPEYQQAYETIEDGPMPPDTIRAYLKSQWGIVFYDELHNPHELPPLETALTRLLPPWDDSLGIFGETRRHCGSVPEQTLPKGKLVLEYYPEHEPYLPYCLMGDLQWSERALTERVGAWIKRLYRLRKQAGLIPPQSARKRGKEKFQEYLQEYEYQRGGKSSRYYLAAVRPPQRHRIAEYRNFLHVYDLRRAGKSYSEIVGEMQWADLTGDMERKVRRYIQNGQDLVLNPPLKPNAFTGGV